MNEKDENQTEFNQEFTKEYSKLYSLICQNSFNLKKIVQGGIVYYQKERD